MKETNLGNQVRKKLNQGQGFEFGENCLTIQIQQGLGIQGLEQGVDEGVEQNFMKSEQVQGLNLQRNNAMDGVWPN